MLRLQAAVLVRWGHVCSSGWVDRFVCSNMCGQVRVGARRARAVGERSSVAVLRVPSPHPAVVG